jgi:POT family proton-dependent oligopeptide transporter
MAVSFVVVSLSQEAIDRGEIPHVGWQILAYFILTSGEVMVSIVALEFFYTQAPKKMKSLMMAIFLTSVSVGNSFTAIVNHVIQVASPEDGPLVKEFSEGNKTKLNQIAGYDGKFNTPDDIVTGGERIESLATEVLGDTVSKIESYFSEKEKLPLEWTELPDDPWGSPIKYQLVSAKEARLSSDGPDKTAKTVWDLGIKITVKEANEDLRGTWLYEAKKKKGLIEEEADDESPISTQYTAGGGLTLDGADYYWFFTKLMIGTVILFIPFAMLYKPRTYLHGKEEEGT